MRVEKVSLNFASLAKLLCSHCGRVSSGTSCHGGCIVPQLQPEELLSPVPLLEMR